MQVCLLILESLLILELLKPTHFLKQSETHFLLKTVMQIKLHVFFL